MSYKKLNIVVVGATGYVGLDLILLLSKHPHVSIKYLCAQKNLGKKIQFFDKRIKKKLPLISNLNKVLWHKVDVLFLSLPDGEAQKLVNQLYTKHKHLKFIDLSGDFRISNINEYFKWYSIKHSAKNLIEKSIYSVSEFSKNSIKNYRIVSNPGCLMVIDNVAKHMPADGSVWVTNNRKYHNAFNGGEENRIHLVACVLDYKFN